MTNMIAKRNGSDFRLFADGFEIGRLADCEVCHIFESDDEEIEGYIAHRIEGDMSLTEMLASVRAGYEAFNRDQASLAKAEQDAENGWLRHAERYDHEAQIDLDLHSALGGF